MKITFVNKNYLIPNIIEFSTLEDSLDKLSDITYNQSTQYNENVYVVYSSKIYFCFNKKFYSLDTKTNNISIHDYNTINIGSLNIIKNFTNNNKLSESIELAESGMTLVINNKPMKNINIDDTKLNTKENIKVKNTTNQVKKELTKEEEQIVKLCEEVMETYQQEKNKIKEIEKKIKVLDNQEKSIKKKILDKIYTGIAKLKGDYHTYKLINLKDKKTLESGEKYEIPVLFTQKYIYFQKLTLELENLELLEQVDNFVLDNIINNDTQIDIKIINLARNYEIISKDLNVKFDHSWEELDVDDGANNNRSLFG
jgi:hypothetical protein